MQAKKKNFMKWNLPPKTTQSARTKDINLIRIHQQISNSKSRLFKIKQKEHQNDDLERLKTSEATINQFCLLRNIIVFVSIKHFEACFKQNITEIKTQNTSLQQLIIIIVQFFQDIQVLLPSSKKNYEQLIKNRHIYIQSPYQPKQFWPYIFISYPFNFNKVINSQIIVIFMVPKYRNKMKLNKIASLDGFKVEIQQQKFNFLKFKESIKQQKDLTLTNEDLHIFAQNMDFVKDDVPQIKHTRLHKQNQVFILFHEEEQSRSQKKQSSQLFEDQSMFKEWVIQSRKKEHNQLFAQMITKETTWDKNQNQFIHSKNVLEHVGFHFAAYSCLHNQLFGDSKDSIPNEFQNFLRKVYESEEQNRKRLNQKGWNIPDVQAQIQQALNSNSQYVFVESQDEEKLIQESKQTQKQIQVKSKQKK